MPSVDVAPAINVTDVEVPKVQIVTKPKIGIIYPPPEVRNIVDKTASFVARNGPDFEARIKQNEMQNPKFIFLNPTDPYHGYYQHKLKEFREGKQTENVVPAVAQKQVIPPKIQEQVIKAQEPAIPKEPPPEYEFLLEPPSISSFELDLVKLAAQFVARNGRQFLTGLMNREQRNPQFDFLRPQHGLFGYFTKLVEHYTKILIYPKDITTKLREELDNPQKVLDAMRRRVEWTHYKEREKVREEEAVERERVAYARIDWHDFVVVETVDYQPNEQGDFPPPTVASEVGARILLEERLEKSQLLEPTSTMVSLFDEMDVSSEPESPVDSEDELEYSENPSDDEETGKSPKASKAQQGESTSQPAMVPANFPVPPCPETVVVKPYDPKAVRAISASIVEEPVLISPITGEKIPASKIADHMRYATLDPRWALTKEKEIRERLEQEEVYAPGASVQSELKRLAERRTDIFGEGDQETVIGRKIGEEDVKVDDKPTWDGHTATMEKTSKKAMQGITIEDQINAIHKAQGLIEDEATPKIGPAVAKPQAALSNPGPTVSTSKPPQNHPPHLFTAPLAPVMIPVNPHLVLPHVTPPNVVPPHHTLMPNSAVMPMNPLKRPGEAEEGVKKIKSEDQLIPEEEFIKKNGKGHISFFVEVPNVPEKPEWHLNGQVLTLTVPLTDTVSVIKAKITDLLGIPCGKQKLLHEGMFVKDSNTLAYYNMLSNSTVQLLLKERGGRKK